MVIKTVRKCFVRLATVRAGVRLEVMPAEALLPLQCGCAVVPEECIVIAHKEVLRMPERTGMEKVVKAELLRCIE